MATDPSGIETEIKLRFAGSPAEARAKVEGLGYRESRPRELEADQLFDTPDSTMKATDRILRLRRRGDTCLLTYKGPADRERHKSREEAECTVGDPVEFARALRGLGYLPSFYYEKYRTELRAEGSPGLITLDETPMGLFIELEGPGDWIDATAIALGFEKSAYELSGYARLWTGWAEGNGRDPRAMKFSE